MENGNFNISIVGYSSAYLRHFIFQFAKLLAKSIEIVGNINKNGVIVELEECFLPDALLVEEDMNYVECDGFVLVNRMLSDEELHKLGFKKGLDYVISDFLKEGADIVFYILEQNLDSAFFVNEMHSQILKRQDFKNIGQRIVFLNFLDNKFSPEYFMEFQLQMNASEMSKYYIDYDEDDISQGMYCDLDADINLMKLSNHRLIEILKMYDGILKIENKKAHIVEVKRSEKMSRRKRKC